VEDLRVGGQPLDLNRDVRFTVNSFLADGGDGHVGLKEGRNRLGGDLDLDALTALLKSAPTPDATPRITLVE
jgi:5'-nucleotidase